MMNKKTIGIISVIFVFAAGIGAFALYKSNGNKNSEMQTNSSTQPDATSATYKQYAAMTGETYDRNFIANMIVHHQGAVDMAKLAQTNATRPELKAMADDIVAAQEKEISQLKTWQVEWGYPSTSADSMQDHSAMGMMDNMAGMTAELEGKTGDDFNKAFIEQMIMHHQSAIDMAAPGKDNAARQEVKDLAAAIVSAQTKEVAQLKTWQEEWGL